MMINRCPNCGSQKVSQHRQIGCAVIVLIFVSFGLGLLMIPFLPKTCACKVCKTTWKP